MECHYLPTMVVPIDLLAFLHAFERLGWWELGQATGAPSVTWIRSDDGWSSDLAAQRLLPFNPQRYYAPIVIRYPAGIIDWTQIELELD